MDIVETKNQNVYNTKIFQSEFIKLKTNPKTYLPRLVSLLNRIYYGNFDSKGFYNIILNGLELKLDYDSELNKINIVIYKGIIIIDSTMIDIKDDVSLDIDLNNLTSDYNDISIIVLVDYKHTFQYESNKLKFKLFLYDSLKGTTYPDWEESDNLMFLNIYTFNKKYKNIEFFHRQYLPNCKSSEEENNNEESIEDNIIDYEHTHTFIHDHEYTGEHLHENINVEITSLGGENLEENEEEVTPPPMDTRPLCDEFINYKENNNNNIIINSIEYKFQKPIRYLDYFVNLFLNELYDYHLKLHIMKIPINNRHDIFYFNKRGLHNN